jgi:arylsulfatase A-like enzyme
MPGRLDPLRPLRPDPDLAAMDSQPRRASFLAVWLSSALAAAALNLATGLLAHPRALHSPSRLGLPLAAGFAACALVAGLVLPLARGAWRAGLVTGLVLAAALAPMVEVGLRDASSERAAVVLACAAGFVLSASLLAQALAPRWSEHGARVLTALPLVALTVLWSAWGFEYGDGRVLALLGGALGLGACVLVSRRLAPGGVAGALLVIVLAHGALDGLTLLRGEPAAKSTGKSAASALPPVVLITVDTLRADRVLGAGAARVPTPAIDRLAADSVVFTHARSAAPWTKPSLATLLTGVSPLVHGMTNRRARLPVELETLAERLRAAGYRTAGIGLNAHLERAFRFDQGFDDYAFPARPDYGIALGARLLERLAPARFPELFPSSTAIADEAVGWLDANHDAPFFLWLHMLDPHWPYEPPAEWVEHPERPPRRWGEPEMVTDVQAGNTKPGAAERARVAELYAGEIRYVDHELERVLARLRELGLYERALIVLASDHGEEFWEHGRYEHGHTLYDEVLRVPLFLKLPGDDARGTLEAEVSTEALLPTVLDVLGLEHDPELLGSRSLTPFWRTPAEAVAGPLFATGTYYFGEKRGVVFDGQKLVLELDTCRSELYDLVADPAELRSLAAARPEALRAGLALLEEWQTRCAELRARLGIGGDDDAQVDDAVQRAMQGLGYAGPQ